MTRDCREVFRQKTRRKMEKLKTAEPKIYEKIMKLEDKQNILNNLVKVNSLARSNNLRKVSNVLREKYRCSVTLQDDGSGKVIGFFFQDYHMRKCFDMFPEILFIDGTYLLQNIACCVYILCVENSLGGSDIVAVGVLTTKEKESVEWVVQKFKDNNPKCDKTVIVVTDKPTSEYDIVPRYFPTATKLICPYHALETFKKDTQPSKVLNVIPSESESALHFFSQLIESKSEEEYHTILEDMEDNVPYSLMDYFINNWHDLRNEWVKGFNPSLRTCINTKLDSSNLKLKSPVANCKTFSRFINNFFLVVYFRRNELQSELNRMVTKKHPEDVTEYSKHLTPYAVQKIKQFLSEMDEVSFDSPNDGSDVICESDGNTFVVSEISCNCDFFTIMKLPCVHLLAYRKSQGVDLFDEYLFSERWTKNYARDLFEEVGRRGDAEGVPTEGKFAKAHYACLSLAGLCSEVGEDVCSKRVEVLEKLRELWESGYEVKVQKLKKGEKEALFDHDYVRLESMESESF